MRLRILLGGLAVAVALPLLGAGAASGAGSTGERIGGPTRYETAIELSHQTFPSGASEIVIARGDMFPDALVASFVASLYNGNGPVLLTPSDRLPAAVKAEVERLDPFRIWILGDRGAVSQSVESELGPLTQDLVRVPGATRYDIPAIIAGKIESSIPHAFVVSGENWPDAVSVAPVANAAGVPIVLTAKDTLPEGARQALERFGTTAVYLVGGPNAVSTAVEQQIRALPRIESVTRIQGVGRQETALRVADIASSAFGFDFSHINLAPGHKFPDALAAGPHGGEEMAVTLLTRNADDLGDYTRNFIARYAHAIDSIHGIGQADVLSDAILDEAVGWAQE